MFVFQAHIATVHVVERAFACSVCQYRFKTLKMQQTHERQHAPEDEKYQFSCDQCGKQYIQKTSLDSHLKRHQVRPGPVMEAVHPTVQPM